MFFSLTIIDNSRIYIDVCYIMTMLWYYLCIIHETIPHTLSFEWRGSGVSVTVSFASSWSGLNFYMVIVQNWEIDSSDLRREKSHVYAYILHEVEGITAIPRRPLKVFYVTTASFSSF